MGATGGRGRAPGSIRSAFSVLVRRRVTDATNGFRIFRAEILSDPKIDIDQRWLDELRPRAVRPVQGDPARLPGDRGSRAPFATTPSESYTKMRGMKDWWRLFRPALLLRTGVKR